MYICGMCICVICMCFSGVYVWVCMWSVYQWMTSTDAYSHCRKCQHEGGRNKQVTMEKQAILRC